MPFVLLFFLSFSRHGLRDGDAHFLEFAFHHVRHLFDVQFFADDFLVLVEEVEHGRGFDVVVNAEVGLVVGVPAVDEVEEVVVGDEFFPFFLVVLGVDGKDFEAVRLEFVEEVFFDLGNLFFAVPAVGFPEHEEGEGGVGFVEADPVAFHGGEFEFLGFHADEVVLGEDDLALDFLEVFFVNPVRLAAEVVAFGEVDEGGVHAHDFAFEGVVEAVADEVAEHGFAAAGALDEIDGFFIDGVGVHENHVLEVVVEFVFEDGGADEHAVAEVGVVPVVGFVVEVAAFAYFEVTVFGAFGDFLGEVGDVGGEGEVGEGGSGGAGVLAAEVGDVGAHFFVRLFELVGVFFPDVGIGLVSFFFESLADFTGLAVLLDHEFLEFEECLVFGRAFDAEVFHDLGGIGAEGEVLVVADDDVEIVAGGEEEEIHAPGEFLVGVAEGAVAGGVEVGGVYGIDFAFEVVGENEGFVGHFGNGDADVVSGGLRFFPMDGLRSGGLLCFFAALSVGASGLHEETADEK